MILNSLFLGFSVIKFYNKKTVCKYHTAFLFILEPLLAFKKEEHAQNAS